MSNATYSVQDLVSTWWETTDRAVLEPGRLVRTFVPYPDVINHALVVEGRDDPQNHKTALFRVEPLQTRHRGRPSKLPVAALPSHPGESYVAQRGKMRPALVLTLGGPEIPKEVSQGGPGYQRKPCLLVAPYYGGNRDGSRAGFSDEFIHRVRCAEYPQYVLDSLPFSDHVSQALLRLDHVLATGCSEANFEITKYRLSQEALAVVLDWFTWLVEGEIPANSLLELARAELLKIEAIQ